jgi:hypothetical protein
MRIIGLVKSNILYIKGSPLCSDYHTMGVCVSCRRSGKDDAVEDISEEIDSDYSDDDYVERITHITADIHEMIRRKDHTKVGTKDIEQIKELFKHQVGKNQIAPTIELSDNVSNAASNISSNKSSISTISKASRKSAHLSVPSLVEADESNGSP